MQKKSFLMGLGIGMVSVSILFLIGFFAFIGDFKNLQISDVSDEAIVNRARAIGMVYESEVEKKNLFANNGESNTENNTENNVDNSVDNKSVNNKSPDNTEDAVNINNNPINANTGQDHIKIQVSDGMNSDQVAKLLYDNGIIEDAGQFNTYLKENNASRVIQNGEFSFKKGSTYEEVMNIIIK